jgi:hypothetical protein
MSAGAGIVAALARPLDASVVCGPGAPVTWRELERRAAALATRLPPARPGSEVAFAFDGDRLAFVVALLATWMRGHTAVVAEDASRECVAPLLERPGHVLLLHDTGVGRGLFVPGVWRELDGCEPEAALGLDGVAHAAAPVLVAVRRRTSGDREECGWSAAQLVADLDDLAGRLELAPGDDVASTLTPTALPGMLAGVLAPLRRGARFARATPALALAAAEIRASGACTLVTSAAHARVLADLPTGALGAVRRIACVDADPGGVIAARLGTRHAAQAFLLSDLPPLEPLAGELETLRDELLEEESVRDLAILVIEPEGAKFPRGLIGMVSADAALVARCAARTGCEARSLPAIPRDANGRIVVRELLLRFGRGRSGHALVRELGWTEAGEADPGARRFRTRLPERYAFFEGHFPGHPVLSGVAQLHELVLPCARRHRPDLGALERLGRIKFLERLGPGDELEVVLRAGSGPGELVFAIERGGTTCSQGRAFFAPSGSAGA